jgi:exodeoxyribonuclease VII small subunit
MIKNKKSSIEKTILNLEKIVAKMEMGEGSLEDNIKWFDEGIKLINDCRDELESSEKRVKELIKNSEGSFELKNIE